VGREFLFQEIEQFISENPRGYLIISGEPGIGKTALMAKLVKTCNYIHHFNIAAQGIYRPYEFLESVCSLLIQKYGLSVRFSLDATESGILLNRILKKVSEYLEEKGGKEVIVVDALDEVERTSSKENLLFLPPILPPHIYFILSTRPGELFLRINMDEICYYPLKSDEERNLTDARNYLSREIELERTSITQEFKRKGLVEETFIRQLLENSKGNFMYLTHLVRALRRGDYSAVDARHLPKGLEGYYDDFWRRLRERNQKEWQDFYRPLLSALTVLQEAVSYRQLSEILNISIDDVRDVMHTLQEFLYSEHQGKETVYRIYHSSFQQFLERKIDGESYHYHIAEFYGRHWVYKN